MNLRVLQVLVAMAVLWAAVAMAGTAVMPMCHLVSMRRKVVQQEPARQLQQSKQGSAGGQLAVAATVCKEQVGKQC